MLRLVGTVDKPISVNVIPCRSHLAQITGNSGDSVAHGRHLQFRHSFHALKGKRRCKADLVAIKMLWRYVGIVYRHSEKSSLRKNILGFGPIDHGLQGGEYAIRFEGIRNPDIGDLPFGNIDQIDWKCGSLLFRGHRQIIFAVIEEFFANLAVFDLAAFSKLTWRGFVAGAECPGKGGRGGKSAVKGDIRKAFVGITKQTSFFFKAKPTGERIQGLARNCSKNPMEVELREARNTGKLTQLYRSIQILAKIIDNAINPLGVFTIGMGLRG